MKKKDLLKTKVEHLSLDTFNPVPLVEAMEKMAFSGGQSTLQIEGTAPADQNEKITEFWQVLRRKRSGNTNLFAEVQLRPTVQKTVQGVPVIQWSFNCRLLRPEIWPFLGLYGLWLWREGDRLAPALGFVAIAVGWLLPDAFGTEGLFAAGNTMASVMGRTYPGAGGTIGPALTFGFVAANTAITEPR